MHFPGQAHRWKVCGCLQKGSEKIKETFLDDLARAAAAILITSKNRIVGEFFSLKQAIFSIWSGFLTLLGIYILTVNIFWLMKTRCTWLFFF